MTVQRKELVQRLFNTFRVQDRETALQLITDDFSFTSPYDDGIDKAAYFERCWPNAGLLEDQVIEHILVDGDIACVAYRASTSEGMAFRNTELFTFNGDQIGSIEVYFGAAYHHGVFARMR